MSVTCVLALVIAQLVAAQVARAQSVDGDAVKLAVSNDGPHAFLDIMLGGHHATPPLKVELSTKFVRLVGVRTIGNHNARADALPLIAVHYVERIAGSSACAYPVEYPVLSVIDAQSTQVIARTTPPLAQLCASVPTYSNPEHVIPPVKAYVDYPSGPQGRSYPFMAPPYGDGDPVYTSGRWGYLCLFKPGAASHECGANFAKVETLGTQKKSQAYEPFREAGGFVMDVDGDGWEEIVLIYHYTLQTVSVRDAKTIDTLRYNVAYPEDPHQHVAYATWHGISAVPERFKDLHSGRNYAVFSAATGHDGVARVVMVAGSPIGDFSDYWCNVSRYVGALAVDHGRLRLAWSLFYGFQSSTFERFEPSLASTPPVGRPGDFTNGCIHRFSDSQTTIDVDPSMTGTETRREALLFNVFHATEEPDRCLTNQYALYLAPVTNWGDAKYASWIACAKETLKTRGHWVVEAVDLRTGKLLASWPNNYVWGWSDQLVPGGLTTYVVEALPPDAGFDFVHSSREATLSLDAIDKGTWKEMGTFPPSQSRPKIRKADLRGSVGSGAVTTVAELVLEDRDGDGALAIQMSDASWVGDHRKKRQCVTKK